MLHFVPQNKMKENVIFVWTSKTFAPKREYLLIADGLVIKKKNGKYYLDKEKLAQAKAQLSSKNTK
jgi:hypothetical protein